MFNGRCKGSIANENKQDGHWFTRGWGGSSLQGLGENPVDKQGALNFTLLFRVSAGKGMTSLQVTFETQRHLRCFQEQKTVACRYVRPWRMRDTAAIYDQQGVVSAFHGHIQRNEIATSKSSEILEHGTPG